MAGRKPKPTACSEETENMSFCHTGMTDLDDFICIMKD